MGRGCGGLSAAQSDGQRVWGDVSGTVSWAEGEGGCSSMSTVQSDELGSVGGLLHNASSRVMGRGAEGCSIMPPPISPNSKGTYTRGSRGWGGAAALKKLMA